MTVLLKFGFLFLFMLFARDGFAQITLGGSLSQQSDTTNKSKNSEDNLIADCGGPWFKGGIEALKSYFQDAIDLSRIAATDSSKIDGKVYVSMLIEKDGSIKKIRIDQSIENCPACSEEVVRVVKLMPLWEPYLLNGKPERKWFTLPIYFKI